MSMSLKQLRPDGPIFFEIASSGGVLSIFCYVSECDIEQIDIWLEIVSRVSMLGESRSW